MNGKPAGYRETVNRGGARVVGPKKPKVGGAASVELASSEATMPDPATDTGGNGPSGRKGRASA
ncbi:hypothetical protein [Thalassobaculum sp.]|uniref:hypothetical protein n=1 Tax=Thalassobaculum sp. TaxID=2022740 RepID=UPI0032ED7FB0